MIGIKFDLKKHVFVLIVLALAVGCSDSGSEESNLDEVQQVESDANQDDQGNILSFNGKLFSIPSPIQTAGLIKRIGFEYRGDLINEIKSVSDYTTVFKQALNLGIYGADFAYVAYYGYDDESLRYMKAIRKMVEELDLTAAIDQNLAEKMAENINNTDSILYLSSVMFRTTDNYLKNNDRNEVAALILTGGFIESLYFFSHLAQIDESRLIEQRIGEEKQTIETLMQVLSGYDREEYKPLLEHMASLVDAFSQVSIEYKYNRPETDPIKKVTKITSESKVVISEETLTNILDKTTAIRNYITE